MLIKLIHVDVETKTAKNGKTFEQAEVLYESDGKKNTKKIMSFYNPAVFKAIKDSERGKSYQVELIKDDAGYWQWTKYVAADGYVESSKPLANNDRPSTSPPANRNFETKEERDARQRLIVRQSSLNNAVAILTPGSKTALDPDAVKRLADDLTDWVFEKVDIFDMPNDLGID